MLNDINQINEAFSTLVAMEDVFLRIENMKITSYQIASCFNNMPVLRSLAINMEQNYAMDISQIGNALQNSNLSWINIQISQVDGDNSFYKDMFQPAKIPNVKRAKVSLLKSHVSNVQDIFLYAKFEELEFHFSNSQWEIYQTPSMLDFAQWDSFLDTMNTIKQLRLNLYVNTYPHDNLFSILQTALNKVTSLTTLYFRSSNIYLNMYEYDLPNLEFLSVGFSSTGANYIDFLKNPNVFQKLPKLQRFELFFNTEDLIATQMPSLLQFTSGFVDKLDIQSITLKINNGYLKSPWFQDLTHLINPYAPFKIQNGITFQMNGYWQNYGSIKTLDGLNEFLTSWAQLDFLIDISLQLNKHTITTLDIANSLGYGITKFNNLRFVSLNLADNLLIDLTPMKNIFNFDYLTQKIPIMAEITLNRGNSISDQSVIQDIIDPLFYYGSSRNDILRHDFIDTFGQGSSYYNMNVQKQYVTLAKLSHCKVADYSLSKYYNQSNNTCDTCFHKFCHLCVNSTECSKCRFSRTVARILPECYCPSGYYDQIVPDIYFQYDCLQCKWGCDTCSNDLTCNSCIISNTVARVLPGCGCPAGYTDDLVNPDCVPLPCMRVCLTCSDSISCDLCIISTPVARLLSSDCTCPDRFYDDLANDNCQSCIRGCLTCSNNLSCGTCLISTPPRIVGQNCTCPAKYFDDQSNDNCQDCFFGCATCSNILSCDTCVSSTPPRIVGSKCACPAKYFDDLFNNDCQNCFTGCATCSNISSCDTCILSTPPRILGQKCACPAKYFDDLSNESCQNCFFGCATCSSFSSCDTCVSSTPSRIVGSKCSCPAKYYDNLTNDDCQNCFTGCATCSNISSCDSCVLSTPSRIIGSKCSCPAKYFDDLSNDDCQDCLKGCATCSNISSCDTCISSTPPRIVGSKCACPVKYFDDLTNDDCQSCMIVCQTCSNNFSCDSCIISNPARINSQCGCPSGYYDDGVNSDCQPCMSGCLICSDGISCDSCVVSNPIARISASNCICPDKYFDDLSNDDCQSCLRGCQTCSNNSACDQCIFSIPSRILGSNCACPSKFFDDLINDNCQVCLNGCQTCSDNITCDTCKVSIKPRVLGSQCACPIGTFDDLINDNCIDCNSKCTSCQNVSSCLTCPISIAIRIPSDLCACPDQYYDDGSNNECQNCQSTCLTCSNATTCDSCKISTPQRIFSNICSCPEGFYDNGTDDQCQPCLNSCLSCSDGITCNSCKVSDPARIGAQCECIDQDGYYDDGINAQCAQIKPLDCEFQCIQCEETIENCTICAIGNFRNLQAPTCGCLDGYYQPAAAVNGQDSLHCIQCPSQCKTCNIKSLCLTCTNSRFQPPLCRGTGKGFFSIVDPNSNQQVVKKCPNHCDTCDSQGVCLTCTGINRQIDSAPDCLCKSGYHDENKTFTQCSQKCHHLCKKCVSNDICTVCSNELNRTLDKFSGQCVCDRGYKQNQNLECQKCYSFESECHFKCPKGTITNQGNQTCEKIGYEFIDNVMLICISSVCVLFVISLSYIIANSRYNRLFLSKSSVDKNIGQQQQQKIQFHEDKQYFQDNLKVQSILQIEDVSSIEQSEPYSSDQILNCSQRSEQQVQQQPNKRTRKQIVQY